MWEWPRGCQSWELSEMKNFHRRAVEIGCRTRIWTPVNWACETRRQGCRRDGTDGHSRHWNVLDLSSYVLSLFAVRRFVSTHIEEACERSSEKSLFEGHFL